MPLLLGFPEEINVLRSYIIFILFISVKFYREE